MISFTSVSIAANLVEFGPLTTHSLPIEVSLDSDVQRWLSQSKFAVVSSSFENH